MGVYIVTYKEQDFKDGKWTKSEIPVFGESEANVKAHWNRLYGAGKYSRKQIIDIEKAKPKSSIEARRIYDKAITGKCIRCGIELDERARL